MSVSMGFLFPFNPTEDKKTGTFRIKDMLIPDQDYDLFGHIIEMSIRSSSENNIPLKPSMEVVQMTQEQKVTDLEGKNHIPDQDFYLCRAKEFQKLPKNIETSDRNNAIVAFLQALDPEQFVVIKMSW